MSSLANSNSDTEEYTDMHKCSSCGKSFKEKKNRNKHMKNCSKDKNITKDSNERIPCYNCQKSFDNKQLLEAHQKRKRGNKIVGCLINKDDTSIVSSVDLPYPSDSEHFGNISDLDISDEENDLNLEIIEKNKGYDENILRSPEEMHMIFMKNKQNNENAIKKDETLDYQLGLAEATIENLKESFENIKVFGKTDAQKEKNLNMRIIEKMDKILIKRDQSNAIFERKDTAIDCCKTCIWVKRRALFHSQQVIIAIKMLDLKIVTNFLEGFIVGHLRDVNREGYFKEFLLFLRRNFESQSAQIDTWQSEISGNQLDFPRPNIQTNNIRSQPEIQRNWQRHLPGSRQVSQDHINKMQKIRERRQNNPY